MPHNFLVVCWAAPGDLGPMLTGRASCVLPVMTFASLRVRARANRWRRRDSGSLPGGKRRAFLPLETLRMAIPCDTLVVRFADREPVVLSSLGEIGSESEKAPAKKQRKPELVR
jgi:hypothetical protein